MPLLKAALLTFQVLLLSCSNVAALRIPNLNEDPLCARRSAYDKHTERGFVILTQSGKFEFVEGLHTSQNADSVAWGSYLDNANTISNFGHLNVHTSGDFSDTDQVFGAGFLEGYLTAPRIHQNYLNLHTYFIKTLNVSLEDPMQWIQDQDAWVRQQCEEQRGIKMPHGAAATGSKMERSSDNKTDNADKAYKSNMKARFWDATCLAIRQFDGVVAGYQARYDAESGPKSADNGVDPLPPMSYLDFLFMESNADLYDVIDMIDPTQGPSWNPGGDGDEPEMLSSTNETEEDKEKRANKLFHALALSGKCSALVKMAADFSDIYMGHSTWDSYTAMGGRIFKHYAFDLQTLDPAAQRLSFSSYAGQIFSDDDFFILSSKMVILQTTNKIFNEELFESLTTQSVLSWQRMRAANWLAHNGEEWVQYLEMENSGTYNNQYMAVDLKQFTPGQVPASGLLWVAEQIPGQVVSADMTRTLALGYWPSFNVPAFPEIYNASGYPDFISKIEKYGKHFSKSTRWLSYELSPRSAIFRRDHTSVTSLDTMKALMRSNNWKNDPLSEGHPICSVCGRGDLDKGFPEARGCYDSKVTSYSMALNMQAEAVNGPTTGASHSPVGVNPSTKLPEFDWKATEKAVGMELVHVGQPEKFNFQFERMQPEADAVGRCGDAALQAS